MFVNEFKKRIASDFHAVAGIECALCAYRYIRRHAPDIDKNIRERFVVNTLRDRHRSALVNYFWIDLVTTDITHVANLLAKLFDVLLKIALFIFIERQGKCEGVPANFLPSLEKEFGMRVK